MGYYINEDSTGKPMPKFGKIKALVADGATLITGNLFEHNLICIVDRITHDAAIYCYDEIEYERVMPSLMIQMDVNIPDKHPYPRKAYFDFSAFSDIVEEYKERETWTDRGMYAFVCWQWVEPFATWIGKRKVLEVMAGAGWLARALTAKGIEVIATDDYSWADKRAWSMQTTVEKMDAVTAIEQYGSTSDILLISWPYMDPSAFEAIRKWNEINPEGLIVYIGEQEGGCTANDAFFEHFEVQENDSFREVSANYCTWDGLHDTIILGKYKP